MQWCVTPHRKGRRCGMNDLKTSTVLYLSKNRATDEDRAAAKLFARCQVELRHVGADVREDARRVTVDVLVHATPDTIGEMKSSDAAGRDARKPA